MVFSYDIAGVSFVLDLERSFTAGIAFRGVNLLSVAVRCGESLFAQKTAVMIITAYKRKKVKRLDDGSRR